MKARKASEDAGAKRSSNRATKLQTTHPGKSTPPCYRDAGWFQWPENEEYSLQFMRVLASAQEGASTISECFFAARLITPGDDESWYDAWKTVAKTNDARGDEAFEQGGLNAATGNWLRASNYYRTAGAFLESKDPRRKLLIGKIRACSRLYLEHARPKGEVVRIPFDGSNDLEGAGQTVGRPFRPEETRNTIFNGYNSETSGNALPEVFNSGLPSTTSRPAS